MNNQNNTKQNKNTIGNFQMIQQENSHKLNEIKKYFHDEKDKLTRESLVNTICSCYNTIFNLNETLAKERDNFRAKIEEIGRQKRWLFRQNIYTMVAFILLFILYVIK